MISRGAASMVGACLVLGASLLAKPPAGPPRDYPNDIEPLLRAHCTPCHNGDSQKGRLRLDSVEGLEKGGVSGALWKKGDPKNSLIVQRMRGELDEDQMPLGFAPLSEAKIGIFEEWIRQGAKLTGTLRPHWTYVPPRRPPMPSVKLASWAARPLDRLALAKMEEAGLKPSPRADKLTLLRRISLDLTGLPPTPEEVEAFLADQGPNALERAIDRHLASPHFGERMAQPWLDLARFADSNGYEKDRNRTIWPYRDWVIQAFNSDMAYTRFIEEQLAGDLLPDGGQTALIATGFQRNTMHNEEGGVDQGEQRWLTLVDRVAVTGSVFLASSIACAQCHDHKYDPTSQEDFYRMLAFYESSDEPTLHLDPEARRALQEELSRLQKDLTQTLGRPEEKEIREKISQTEGKLWRLEAEKSTLILRENPDKKAETPMRNKGAYLSPGRVVTAGVPKFLGSLPEGSPANRLSLARWIGSRQNPLSARVAVNRVWEMLFGVGLVKTSDDLGLTGEDPPNQPLLDWLAVEFMEGGWKFKPLLKTILLSNTYQQSSKASEKGLSLDPENRLLARGPRFRLPAEHIRDSALAASGLLVRKVGGPSVMPDQPDGVWNTPYNSETWTVSQGENRWRRSLYTHWKRSSPYPLFTTFDATSREACTTIRVRTNTPLQALALMNDKGLMEAARALAKVSQGDLRDAFQRVVTRPPSAEELSLLSSARAKLEAKYQAHPEEAKKVAGPEATPSQAAHVLLCQTILNLDEALTKE